MFNQENAFENVVCEMASVCLAQVLLFVYGTFWNIPGVLSPVSMHVVSRYNRYDN